MKNQIEKRKFEKVVDLFGVFGYLVNPMTKTANKTSKKNQTEKTGWVVKDKEAGEFLNRNKHYAYTKKLHNAQIFPTRSEAREEKLSEETVLKVVLHSKTNRALQIVGRNGGGKFRG